MIASSYIDQGHPIKTVVEVLGIARSSFYYKPVVNGKPRGKKMSTHTFNSLGQCVSNDQVVKDIGELLAHEFVDYGYLKITHWLRQHKNYIINPKKVYRLMQQNGLLNKNVPKKRSKRNWVKQLVPKPLNAFEYLEFDIKYIYVGAERRNALLLSVIDVQSRWVLGHIMAWNIRQKDVLSLFDQIFEVYPLPKHFYVRCDNGSQFEASAVQAYFDYLGVTQEFCKPATPEQNAHIESYHSIIEKVVCARFEFEDLRHCQNTMNRFLKFYNFERIHSGIGYTAPGKYLRKQRIDMENCNLEETLDCSSTKSIFLV